jgi:alanine-glyoxylate transaminase/serine-glyoxylate transaminase/serine-pyruvate transaminase
MEQSLQPLVMIPGPTPVHPRILAALAKPTASHQSDQVAQDIIQIQKLLYQLLNPGPDSEVFVVSGSGTLAMEMAIVNFVPQNGKVLVLSHGRFGDRFAEISRAYGYETNVIAAEPGKAVTADDLERQIERQDYDVITITHVDTSTGVKAPLDSYISVLSQSRAIVVVDGVCATGGIPEDMSYLGVDVLITGAQKALGVPPGLAILVANAKAMQKLGLEPRRAGYYLDLLRWRPSMRDPHIYFSTHPVNMIYALREACNIIQEETINTRYIRHVALAAAFRAGLSMMGMQCATDTYFLAPTLSVIRLADGLEESKFRAELERFGVVVAGGMGPFAGSTIRVGHMGNITFSEIEKTLVAISRSLKVFGYSIDEQNVLSRAYTDYLEHMSKA